MKIVLMIVGIAFIIFGAVDIIGANFMGFDLWLSMGIELPQPLWQYSAYIELAIGFVVFGIAGKLGSDGDD